VPVTRTQDVPIDVVIEDDLSLEIVNRVINELGYPFVIDKVYPDRGRKSAERGSGYILKKIKAFNNMAEYKHVMVLLDLDNNECAPQYKERILTVPKADNFIFQIAVREVESWLLADRQGLSDFLSVPVERIPLRPDTLDDPKETLIGIARKSRKRDIRQGIPPVDATASIGRDYNYLLRKFVRDSWNLNKAAKVSESLSRFLRRMQKEAERV